MKDFLLYRGFSLVELLVALAILAIVAGAIVPRYLSIQSQAEDTVAKQIQSELNVTYANWKASGGTVTGTPYGSMILALLGNPAPNRSAVSATLGGNVSTVSDSDLSKNISIALPPNTPDLAPGTTSPTNFITGGTADYAISFSGETFTAIPQKKLGNLQWQLQTHIPAGMLNSGGAPPAPSFSTTYRGMPFTIPGGLPPQSGDLYNYTNGTYLKIQYALTTDGGGCTWELWYYTATQ